MVSENIKKLKHFGYIEGWLSIFLNTLLFVLKYWAGVVSGSVAIIADAWHTLSDSLTSLIVIIGTKISYRPADEKHPFGHGRAELIGSVIIAVLLAVVAASFLMESIKKLINNKAADFGILAIVATVVSILVKEGLAQFSIRLGKKINSESLKADGWHHRSDSISSLIVLVGIFTSRYFWWIDGLLGIIVSAIIFYAVYEIMKNTVSILIGEEPDKDLIEKIHHVIKERYPDMVNIHHIHIHKYGYHWELTSHIRLPDEMNLHDAHEIVTNLEELLMADLGIEATIHPEPLSHMPK